jgi:hypothetical protein
MQDDTKVVPVGNICSRCSVIDMNAVLAESQQLESSDGGLGVGTLLANLGPVCDWSPDSCWICKMLLASIPEASRQEPPNDYSLRFHFAKDKRIQIYYPILRALPSMMTILKMDGPTAQAHYVSSPFLILQRVDAEMGVCLLKSRSIDFSVVRNWLNICWELHTEKCGAPNGSTATSLTLIDCQTRRVARADPAKNQPYATLSYVCGTINDPPHASDQLPSPAPETIEDAIKATLYLGLQYLWVDRYCIDQENLANKLAQLNQMNLIYSNSEVTLVAAAGQDAYYGLPGVSTRPRTPHPHANFEKLQLISTLQPIGPVRGALDHSYWSTRAWCYQEALLSKRRLIFTDEQVYYECHGMSCCEVLNLPYKDMHKENGQSFKDEYLHFSTREVGKFTAGVGNAPYHLYKRIEEYTNKNLSYQTDRLNAFLGILNRFEKELHSSRHLWGQPMIPDMDTAGHMANASTRSLERARRWYGLGSFVDGLAWAVRGYATRESARPSWSWTGWANPVRYRFIYASMEAVDQFPVVAIKFEDEDSKVLDWNDFQARYTTTANASQSCHILHISAMTLEMRFIEYEESGFHFELDLKDGCYLSWPATTIPDGNSANLTTWLLRDDLPEDTNFHALMLSRSALDGTPSYIFLLIIAEVGGGLERVGGGWLGVETTLNTPSDEEILIEENGEWISALKAKYGLDWWTHLVGERQTHRLR